MSGVAVQAQRSSRVPGARTNPNLFERDEAAVDALFQCDEPEVTCGGSVRRLSVSGVLHSVPKEVDDLVDPLGVDIDALAASAEPSPVKLQAAPVQATPHKAPGDYAATAVFAALSSAARYPPSRSRLFVDLPTPDPPLTLCIAGKKKTAGSLFQDVDDDSLPF